MLLLLLRFLRYSLNYNIRLSNNRYDTLTLFSLDQTIFTMVWKMPLSFKLLNVAVSFEGVVSLEDTRGLIKFDRGGWC